MKRIILHLIVFIVLIFTFNKDTFAIKKITIKDTKDRLVQISKIPNRILCIGPGALRLIVYLNALDRIVGIEEVEKRYPYGRPYIIAHPELLKLPTCGPGGAASINKKPDLEAVISLKPDLIFVTYMDPPLADEIQSVLGIPIVILDYGGFATVNKTIYKSLLIAGTILNKKIRANNVIKFINAIKEDLYRRTYNIPKKDKKFVYVGGIGYRGSHGIESTEITYLPFDWTYSKNIVKTLETSFGSHIFLDKEKLLALNPDVIFLDCGGLKIIEDDFYKKKTYYLALKAFLNRNVYILLPFNWYATNVGTALVDAYAVGKILYPNRFKDINIEKKADYIYKFLVGRPIYKEMERQYQRINSMPYFLKGEK